MVAHLVLIYAEHQSVKDCGWEVVGVHLGALVGWGDLLLLVLVGEEEQVTV
jgi:hypothetical protein